jgi:hypothetical protein
MNDHKTHKFTNPLIFQSGLAVTFVLSSLTHTQVALADSAFFQPGNLVVSRVVYDNNANNVTVGMTLPPNCVPSGIIRLTYQDTPCRMPSELRGTRYDHGKS